MKVEAGKAELTLTIQALQEKLDELEGVITPIIPQDWLTTDLTMPQLKVMTILWREGPARMSELASGLAVTLGEAFAEAEAEGAADAMPAEPEGSAEEPGTAGGAVAAAATSELPIPKRALTLGGRCQSVRIVQVRPSVEVQAVVAPFRAGSVPTAT